MLLCWPTSRIGKHADPTEDSKVQSIQVEEATLRDPCAQIDDLLILCQDHKLVGKQPSPCGIRPRVKKKVRRILLRLILEKGAVRNVK